MTASTTQTVCEAAKLPYERPEIRSRRLRLERNTQERERRLRPLVVEGMSA